MKLIELSEALQRLSAGEATALYWAKRLEEENGARSKYSPNLSELEAALLEQAKYKYIALSAGKLAGAIAFNEREESIHVEHLGSILPGTGKELLARAELLAKQKELPLTLVPSLSTLESGYYAKLGFTKQNRAGGLFIKYMTGRKL